MASLTPQQQSLLNQISQQAQQIQSQLNTLAAAQKAGMTITPQTSVQQAASYISSKQPSTSSGGTSQTMSALTSGGSSQPSYQNYTIQKGDTLSALANKYGTTIQALLSANPQITNPNLIYAGSTLKIPTITTSPQTQTTQIQNSQIPPQNLQNPSQIPPQSQDWQTAYKQLLDQYQALTQKYANPPTPDTSNISNIYSKAAEDLTAKYQKVLADLQKKQQEDKQRLIGRYAAAGFSEPGILGGSSAGIPGVATKGLNELESQQASDITNLQQAQAGDLDALAAAQASAVQQAQQQALDNYYKQLQLMQSALGNQANLLTYQTPAQQLAQELQKEQIFKALGLGSYAKYEQPKIETIKEKDGSVWEIVRDDKGNIISKSEIIPPQFDSTSGNNSWELVLDPTTNKPLYFFNKSTGKLIPYQSQSSSTSSTDSQPGLWDRIKNFFTEY
jgi:LysM repeat protein